jgi:serine/threonine protein kinase
MNALVVKGSENCLPVGTRLHDFEITGILGEGGFGIVYIAFDHSLQRSVAIKEYMPGVLAARASDHGIRVRAERHRETFDVGLKSFINEARFLAQFDHPSLVKVYRFWEQNHTAYTAMQYYDGRTIKDIVNSSPHVVNEAWCRKILKQILDALEMLYTMRILHRDVSPDNIIVQESGDAVLLDFGSARQIIGDRTRGLTVILKPGYAPVEQYAGDASLDQGAYTDIYALSAVIYFAICKEPPATSIARMVKDPMLPLAERGIDGYSREFLSAIDKGLAVLASERPQTIDAFRELLGIASAGVPRARPGGATQRFAAINQTPPLPPATNTTTGPARKRSGSGSSSSSNVSSGSRSGASSRSGSGSGSGTTAGPITTMEKPAVKKAAPPAKGMHAPAPRWMSHLALGLAVVVILGFGLKFMLSSRTVAQPAPVQTDMAAELPDASAAPEPAAPSDAQVAAAVEAEAATATATVVEEKPTVPDTASYRLAIKPWGTIYVDGEEHGVSPPLKKIALPAGKHKIRIVNPGFPDFQTEVNLAKNKTGTIEHDFAADSK